MRDATRWTENPDGSYSRVSGGTAVAEGYAAMTKAELEDELESRDLPKTGNKDELIARLEENDAA
jgi:SAP domain